MRITLIALACLGVVVGSTSAEEAIQTDWVGGGGSAGPLSQWNDTFDAVTDVSWRAVPGQLALASAPLSPAVTHNIGSGLDHAYTVYAADIDDDGDTDVLSGAYSPNDIVLWRNNGDTPPTWTKQVVIDNISEGISVIAADLDGDGALDIVGASWTMGLVAWWRNIGGDPATWPMQLVDGNFAQAHQVHAADMDADGDLDLFGAAAAAHEIAWWRNDGGSPLVWTRQTIHDNCRGARSVYATDMDGDDDVDVLGIAYDTSDLYLYINMGGDPITWDQQLVSGTFAGAHWVTAGDIDDDGDPDIIGAAYIGDDICWWSNDGASPPVFTIQYIDSAFGGAATVHVDDLDGDGDLDVLGTAWDARRVSWWENRDGAGGTWTEHYVTGVLNQASGLFAADVDGDGDLDPLATGAGVDRVDWWEISQFKAAGELTGSILDLGISPTAVSADWNATVPPATDLRFRFRMSNDPLSMGAWSPEMISPGSLTAPLGRYLQYQVVPATADPNCSPLLRDLTINWSGTSGVAASPPEFGELLLDQNRPNPLNPMTMIPYTVPAEGGFVHLAVFDTSGRLVRTLVNRHESGGHGAAMWNGCDERGRSVASGVYHYRLRVDDEQLVKKMAVAR